jgi:hypothetical protein
MSINRKESAIFVSPYLYLLKYFFPVFRVFTNYRKRTLTISALENFGTAVWVSRFIFWMVLRKKDKTDTCSRPSMGQMFIEEYG